MKSNKNKKKSIKSKKKSSKKSVIKKNGGKSKKKTAERVHNKLKIPIRRRHEPFKTLTIVRKHATVSKDVTNAIKLKTEKNSNANFLKLEIPGDQMDTPAYKVIMPDAFSTTLFAPNAPEGKELIYYLYNTYNFTDDLTKYDIYRRAAHFSAMNAKRASAYDEAALVGMAVCASFDVKRRREKIRMTGKARPGYDNYGRRMLDSPRIMVAKLMKFAQPYVGQIIARYKNEIKVNLVLATKKLKDGLQAKDKDMKTRLRKFLRRNREWVRDRLMCKANPLFLKFPRNSLQLKVVNSHFKMNYRRRGDQDLFNEFNYFSSHLAFSAHFCRVMKTFRLNIVKEDSIIQKTSKVSPMVRVRMTRYSHFPAISVVNYNENDELQTTLPRTPRRAPSIGAVSGYSSDSKASVATDTPLDWEFGWTNMDREQEYRLNFIGDSTRNTAREAGEQHYKSRRWKELVRRKRLLLQENRRFELQDTVPIFRELPKMHPPLFFCKLKSMELNKLRRGRDPQRTVHLAKDNKNATVYLMNRRIDLLERVLPCKADPRIVMSEGWRVFAARENPATFKNVARILKQRSSWVLKNCMSRSATVPRCDRLPMREEGRHKKVFLVLLLLLTLAVSLATMAMISFI